MPVVLSYSAGGSLVLIEFDGHEREQHESSAQVTEHPIEKGADVTDHVRPENDRITIDGLVTNAPIRPPTTNTDGATGSVQGLDITIPVKGQLPIGVPGVGALLASTGVLDSTMTVKAQTLQFDQEFDRCRSVYNELQLLVTSGTVIGISTVLREYADMLIESLSVPKTAADGDSISFTFVAKHVQFAETQTVAAPADPKRPAIKKNKGPQPTTEQPGKSVLWKLLHPEG